MDLKLWWKKYRHGRRKFLRQNRLEFQNLADQIIDRLSSELARLRAADEMTEMKVIPSQTISDQVRQVFQQKIDELYFKGDYYMSTDERSALAREFTMAMAEVIKEKINESKEWKIQTGKWRPSRNQ